MFIWRPIIADDPLCSLKELEDGTYSIIDLLDFHEALDLKMALKEKKNGNTR